MATPTLNGENTTFAFGSEFATTSAGCSRAPRPFTTAAGSAVPAPVAAPTGNDVASVMPHKSDAPTAARERSRVAEVIALSDVSRIGAVPEAVSGSEELDDPLGRAADEG